MAPTKTNISKVIQTSVPKPKFELSEKQICVLKSTSEIILALVLVAGALTLAGALPNIFRILRYTRPRRGGLSHSEWRKRQTAHVQRSFYYLKAQGYIELIPKGDDYIVKVKQKGRKLKRKMSYEVLRLDLKQRRRGEWWFILADIPSKYRYQADKFRGKLKQLGCYALQRTVWVAPVDPRDEIDFVSAYLRINRFVTVIRANYVDPADESVLNQHYSTQNL